MPGALTYEPPPIHPKTPAPAAEPPPTATLNLTAATRTEVEERAFTGPSAVSTGPWKEVGSDFDVTLAGTKAAGYKFTGLLTAREPDPFVRSNATPEYLEALKKKIADSGLQANMASLSVKEAGPHG